jgi:CHRD domain-containing protein
MRHSIFASLFAALALPAAAASAQTSSFLANLDEAQQVPAPTPVGATAQSQFTFDGNTLTMSYSVSASNLSGSGGTHADVRFGDFGQQGGLVFTLAGGPTLYTGVSDPLTPAQAVAVFDGRLYCTIYTTLNPNGEIRGQIVDLGATNVRKGNVNTVGGDPPAPVLTIDGSIGHPFYRALARPAGPASIGIAVPPAGGSGHYAIWIFPGEPTSATVASCVIADGQGGTEQIGAAGFCLPAANTVSPGTCPCPAGFSVGFTSKRIVGNAVANALCLHRIPADPRPPTTLSVNFPVGKWTVLGVIFDPFARTTGPRLVSLTNSVTVVAQ